MFRKLTAGTIVDVPEGGGKATILTCSWLVRVPSNNPEPDSEADCWREIECGARVREHPSYAGRFEVGEATMCDNGHDRLPLEISWAPYGPEWEREHDPDATSHGDRAYGEKVEAMGVDGW